MHIVLFPDVPAIFFICHNELVPALILPKNRLEALDLEVPLEV
jgi:hypothetical protein